MIDKLVLFYAVGAIVVLAMCMHVYFDDLWKKQIGLWIFPFTAVFWPLACILVVPGFLAALKKERGVKRLRRETDALRRGTEEKQRRAEDGP